MTLALIRWVAMRASLNASLTVKDKVTRPCPQTTTSLKKKESGSGIKPRPDG